MIKLLIYNVDSAAWHEAESYATFEEAKDAQNAAYIVEVVPGVWSCHDDSACGPGALLIQR